MKLHYIYFVIKHYIKTYPERRKCYICEIKLKRKDRIKFPNDGLMCSLCKKCKVGDWNI